MREKSVTEVLLIFLKLGLTSFGGPIAHLGYLRAELVARRRWLDDAAYTDLVALCQFLPGPASSQVVFSAGLIRAGYLGGLAAFVGFTLPSAILMTAFAFGARALEGPAGMGVAHGLKLVAVAIVAQAVSGMARTLCPDRQRAAIACLAAVVILSSRTALSQIVAISAGGLVGLWLCRTGTPQPVGSLGAPVSRLTGIAALVAFFLLLVLPPLWSDRSTDLLLFHAFYRSGALVFGGGHVVLPLLSQAFVTSGWVSEDSFLAGYGAAQAIPGPLFTFAAYLGVVAAPSSHGIAGAALGLIGIFLPGMLILLSALPFWDSLRRRVAAQALMRGMNAAVVGLLAAALYDPLWTSSVTSSADFAIALVGFVLLTVWRSPPLVVVVFGAAAGILVVPYLAAAR
jgi:chromate transporter